MVLMTLGIMAQNNTISYQAVVRDANNRLVANQPVSVTIEVLNASDVSVYSETESVTSNANGLISLTVGDANPTEFANINWTGAKFKTTVTVTSTGYEVTNTIPVTSVPLSIYAADVNPEGATVKAIYSKIKADSTTLVNRIVTDSTALHTALIDTANNIRTAVNANAANIATNKQAIIDTANHIRSEMNTKLADYAKTSEVDTKLADYTKTADLPTTIAGQLHDTATNVRGQLADTANVLRGLINNLPKERVMKVVATDAQTTFTLASEPSANYLVKFYINGVLIGDNDGTDAVITVSGTTVTYIPANNSDKALVAGEKIFIYYFY